MKFPQIPKYVFSPIVVIISIAVCIATTFVFTEVSTFKENYFPVAFFALFAGILIEYRRVTRSWPRVLMVTCISYAVSLFWLTPHRNEHDYTLENHVMAWPFAFCVIFLLMAVSFDERQIKAKLDERMTLVYALLFVYWCVDFGLLEKEHNFFKTSFVLSVVFAGYSIYHGLTKTALTKNARLTLSIGNTIIFVVLGIEFAWTVFDRKTFYSASYDLAHLSYLMDYFLLGIGLIYIAQNVILIMSFFPEKNSPLTYREQLHKTVERHTERYSRRQSSLANAVLIILLTCGLCLLNYWLDLVHRNVLIWSVVALLPVLFLISRIISKEPADEMESDYDTVQIKPKKRKKKKA